MAWTAADILDQSGRRALITGANSGLGFHTALELARKGARVLLGCRRRDAAEEAVARIRSEVADADLDIVELDLASLRSVREAAESVAADGGLDLLINNAGLMAIPKRTTEDGFEMQFGVNHLGHFALTGHLIQALGRTEGSRIVTVSSNAHRFGRMDFDDLMAERRYRKWRVYSQSKLANLLFTRELQRRLELADTPTISVAAHPGYAATELQHKGPKMAQSSLQERIMDVGNRFFTQSASDGALPQLRAATDPGVKGGEYYGPSKRNQNQGPPIRVGRSAAAKDDTAAQKLWAMSVELTGVTYPL